LPILNADQSLVREVIQDLQLPHHRAARVLGVSYAAIHAWLNGLRTPTVESLLKLEANLSLYRDNVERLRKRVDERLQAEA
jgi:transcriptional regulator with XRE-family HTH domain